jgi:hypothetical protein
MLSPNPPFPLCSLCKLPVTLESSKTDENGKPVHETMLRPPNLATEETAAGINALLGHYRISYFFPALIFAHLFFCAAAILFRPAADILRRTRVVFFAPPSSRCNT